MSVPRPSLIWLHALLIGLGLFAHLVAAHAHESRPAYLEVTEISPGRYDLLWRTPVLSGMRLPVVLELPAGTRDITAASVREFPDSIVERRLIEVEGGLAGKRLVFAGLQAAITDVLARVQLLDSAYSTTLVQPSRPWLEIAAPQGAFSVFGSYLTHGVKHILLGYDHLLFVLALMLIVRNTRVLVWTITAFTIAHSITLALAALGLAHVPGPPVEAAIALSILLLATEILHVRRGRPSLTARWPWMVAFSFGLLHGFGFAGALTDIGLPQDDVPLALFAFNVGVELGQLLFITVVLTSLALFKHVALPRPMKQQALPAAAYGIGMLAAFWFVERLAGF